METVLLILALSLDAFAASVAYGSKEIKIPFLSIIIINIICTFFLTISILGGAIVKTILPGNITTIISFAILMLLGIYYFFEGIAKTYLEKSLHKRKVELKLFDILFIINIYIDETKADYNESKNLNSREAIYLAVALSLDSLAVGFGSALGSINIINVIILSIIVGMLSIWTGMFIGGKIAKKSKVNLSWLAGIILMVLAILKLN